MVVFSNVDMTYAEAEQKALEGLSFHINKGEMVALTGESGSGKTTVLSLLLKEIAPTGGTILVDDRDISNIKRRDIPQYRRELGVVFQDFRLIPELSVYDNLSTALMALKVRPKDHPQRIASTLSMIGIDRLHKRKPGELSGGECQKVCIARALINYPKLLICDEPTGNLDPKSSAEIFDLLNQIHQRGITTIVATHDIEQINRLNCREISLKKPEIKL